MLRDSSVVIQFRAVPDQLEQALESAIVFGEMAPGARVIEEEIAERYGVSRSPVREVLRRLESDGLLIRDERRGMRVTPMSRRDLDDVYVCRVSLEGIAAAEAAVRRDEQTVPALGRSLAALEQVFTDKDIKGYFIANVAFTRVIHEAAANPTLSRLLSGIGKQALRYRYRAYNAFPDLMAVSVEGSRDIVDMIAERNAEGARRVTERLIERSWRALRDCVDE
jgi:GntR family transcriptional regulator, rspAB operon transcriptional repressor